MANFIVRVELHQASNNTYSNLHARMNNNGYLQQIISTDNVIYDLPTAEYSTSKQLTASQVQSEVHRIALQVCPQGALVLVTEARDIAWYLIPS